MGSYTGTVPTFLAGELPDSDKFDEITDFMTADTSAWTAYTPTWTVSAGSVSIGNGTIAGRYRLIGKTVDFSFNWTAGSTTTYGTGGAFWTFGLPPVGNAVTKYAFACRFFNTAVLEYGAIAAVTGAGIATFDLYKPVSGRATNTDPFTFGDTDQIYTNGTYEIS